MAEANQPNGQGACLAVLIDKQQLVENNMFLEPMYCTQLDRLHIPSPRQINKGLGFFLMSLFYPSAFVSLTILSG